MNGPHAENATAPARDAQKFRWDDWNGVVLPLAMALVGLGAALFERGIVTVVLVGVLLVLETAGARIGWRRRRAAADVHRMAAEHRMLREKHREHAHAVCGL